MKVLLFFRAQPSKKVVKSYQIFVSFYLKLLILSLEIANDHKEVFEMCSTFSYLVNSVSNFKNSCKVKSFLKGRMILWSGKKFECFVLLFHNQGNPRVWAPEKKFSKSVQTFTWKLTQFKLPFHNTVKLGYNEQLKNGHFCWL